MMVVVVAWMRMRMRMRMDAFFFFAFLPAATAAPPPTVRSSCLSSTPSSLTAFISDTSSMSALGASFLWARCRAFDTLRLASSARRATSLEDGSWLGTRTRLRWARPVMALSFMRQRARRLPCQCGWRAWLLAME